MFYIVGLGNVGDAYKNTPHNIGFALAEYLQAKHQIDFSNFQKDTRANSYVSQGEIAGVPVDIIKPHTMMNQSGKSLKDIEPQLHRNIIVIYDDIDLPFGTVKIARSRGSGGHNGLKSIESELKTRNFIRLRVGVCPIDWLGKARKPKGAQAVSHYLVGKRLSRWYTERYQEIGDMCDRYIHAIVNDGYEVAVSKQK